MLPYCFSFFSTHSPFGLLSLCLTLTHSLHLATPSHSLLWCTSFSGYPTLSVYPHFSRSLPLPSTTQTVLFSSSRNSLLPSTLKQMAVSVLCCNGIVPAFALHVERVKAINFAFVSSLRLVAMLIVIACIQCIIYPLNYFWISLAYKALRYIHKYILTATTNTHLPFHYRQPFQTYWLNPRNARISHKTKSGRSRHFILNEYSAVLKIPCEAVLVKSDSYHQYLLTSTANVLRLVLFPASNESIFKDFILASLDCLTLRNGRMWILTDVVLTLAHSKTAPWKLACVRQAARCFFQG